MPTTLNAIGGPGRLGPPVTFVDLPKLGRKAKALGLTKFVQPISMSNKFVLPIAVSPLIIVQSHDSPNLQRDSRVSKKKLFTILHKVLVIIHTVMAL